MHEISREFRFDAAHTLQRSIDIEPSRRVHGHSYRAEITVRGRPDPATGMVIDLARLAAILEPARDGLDHRLLDAVEGLGPPTLENLASWIWRTLAPNCPGLWRVTVRRDSDAAAASVHGPDGI